MGKEGTFHEIVMKFGDSGREIGTEAATGINENTNKNTLFERNVTVIKRSNSSCVMF